MRNLAGHIIVMSFLASLVGGTALSNSLAQTIQNTPQDVTVQPYVLFAKKDIGGAGGIYEFVNDQVDKAQGISNVEKGKLPQNQAFIFNEVSIGYSIAATGLAGEVDYISKVPAALANAEFEISQNGRVVLNMPVSTLTNQMTGTSNDDQWTKVGSLCYLTDNLDFTWSFKFPAGATVAAGTTGNTFPFVQVQLRGHRTIRKS